MMTHTLLNLNSPIAAAETPVEKSTEKESTDLLSEEFAAMFASINVPPQPPVEIPVQIPIEVMPDTCITIAEEVVEGTPELIELTETEVETASGTGILELDTATAEGAVLDRPVEGVVRRPLDLPSEQPESPKGELPRFGIPLPPSIKTTPEVPVLTAPGVNSAESVPEIASLAVAGTPQPVDVDLELNQKLESDSLVLLEKRTASAQAEATRRISNLIAGYVVEGSRRDSSPLAAHLSSLGQELDPTARHKRFNLDASRLSELGAGLRPFVNRVANEIAAAPETTILSQVTQRLLNLATTTTQRVETLSFRLKPARLGELELKITKNKDGSISARVTADHDVARAALSRSLGELREALERAGFQVDELQVSSQAAFTDKHRHDSEAKPADKFSPDLPSDSILADEANADGGTSANSNRLLSLRA